MSVPNRFPTQPSQLKIALIGEAPGADEERLGEPFVGMSGRFLAALLAKAGTTRESCFLGNISQYRPPNNDFSSFSWDGFQVQQGLNQLADDLEKFNPNVTVLLGNIPLKAAKDPSRIHPLKPNAFSFKNANWRGSLFIGHDEGPLAGRKCLATYHPAYCLRDYDCTPLLGLDLRKAVREGTKAELVLPKREFFIPTKVDEAVNFLTYYRGERRLTALDIEGGLGTMSCISFSNDPKAAVIIPFFRRDYSPWWAPDEALLIWRNLALLLEDSSVPKCLQNSLYDRFVLHYSYGIRVRGVAEDIMLKHWELNSELEKSLAVQCSIYTDEPYYKGDRKTQDDKTFFEYCGRDSCVTLEICQKLDRFLVAKCSREHYYMNVAMLNPLLAMELQGIKYNPPAALARRTVLQRQLYEAQARLNKMTNRGFSWETLAGVRARISELMLTKKGDRPYKKYETTYERVRQLLGAESPDLATMGEIEDLCEVSLNLSSDDQFIPYLYNELGLPPQFKETKGQEPRRTADYEALLKLSKICQQGNLEKERAIVQTCIEIRALETRQRMLGISADPDGRIRCGYNIVGSNTGRITCYESPTGSGYNLQTIPNYTSTTDAPGGVLGDRDLFLADSDFWFFQCDLKGADGWTVAAYCAMLGDSTMLDDYRFGLKPYQILCLKLRGYTVDFRDRTILKTECKRVEKDAWDAFACKRVQHGGAYLEGDITISRNILKDSEGKLYMTPTECGAIRRFYLERYWGIPKWHAWVAHQIKQRPVLVAASGQVRQFNGRPDEILTKAVAFEPQANTSYATNLAIYKLWTDADNRVVNGNGCKLTIEPLHQVHDAVCGQFPKAKTEWAIGKIRSYFDNPLKIAGQSITIPFDGAFGISWGNTKEGVI